METELPSRPTELVQGLLAKVRGLRSQRRVLVLPPGGVASRLIISALLPAPFMG